MDTMAEKRRKRRSVLWFTATVVIIGLLAFFGVTTVFHKTSAGASSTRTSAVTRGTVQSSVTASGTVAPADSEEVNFATSGTLATLNVKVGQEVKAGEVLGTLNASAANLALQSAQASLLTAQETLTQAQNGNQTTIETQQNSDALSQAQAAVTTAQDTLDTDQTNLTAAEAACAVDPTASTDESSSNSTGTACTNETADQAAVTNDTSSLSSAQSSLTSTQLSQAASEYVSPGTLAVDEAAVATDQNTVNVDQKTVTDTTVTAPTAGTVTAVNDAVGDSVTSGVDTAISPSSTATSSTDSSSDSSSSSDGFVDISNLSSLVVVGDFPEADASKVNQGAAATVTFPDLTGISVTAKVTDVATAGTATSDVVTYADTATLIKTPSTVLSGMNAEISVITASAKNVIEVPTTAITTTGGKSTVIVVKNKRDVTTKVTLGIHGSTDTQIKSGLSVGELVKLPSVTVNTTPTTTSSGSGTLGGSSTGGLSTGGVSTGGAGFSRRGTGGGFG
jgi:multidrug efflux pump subunit AcrA (membrane-fusion protein)